MLFSSLVFLFIFLPLVLSSYYLVPRKFKNLVLLVFSLFFYFYGGPKYLLVMIFSIAVNYLGGLLVDRYREEDFVKYIIFIFVLINLSVIGYYKYYNFFITNINNIFNLSIEALNIVMPIGISFFTFQGLSYVIDIYRQDGKVQKNPLNVALYIALFPQLIAGPIVRYETVADQLENRRESLEDFEYGIRRFILGLAKKVILANNMGFVADKIFLLEFAKLSVLSTWLGVIAYTLQIYFDFSGYSDMAIGLGKMFGFTFLENFNYPYISKSITEFWRRWHISLSTWFRDYVYIPLGGNRVTSLKYLRNILLVWLLTGLWHGASWNFILWGLYYGILLLIEKFILRDNLERLPSSIRHIYTMFFVLIGWLIFRTESIGEISGYLKIMFGLSQNPAIDNSARYYLLEYRYAFILSILFATPIYPYLSKMLKKSQTEKTVNLCSYGELILLPMVFLLTIMYLVNSSFNPFIYFRF